MIGPQAVSEVYFVAFLGPLMTVSFEVIWTRRYFPSYSEQRLLVRVSADSVAPSRGMKESRSMLEPFLSPTNHC